MPRKPGAVMKIRPLADPPNMDRRSEPRFEVYYRAKITPVYEPETQIDAELTDISGGGMRLIATKELAQNELVCVEVGQHLVLAEVRRAIPRGSRFLIGTEKIHTVNTLTLSESITPRERILALVDDYHLRIQIALESNSEASAAAPMVPSEPNEQPTTPVVQVRPELAPIAAVAVPPVPEPALASAEGEKREIPAESNGSVAPVPVPVEAVQPPATQVGQQPLPIQAVPPPFAKPSPEILVSIPQPSPTPQSPTRFRTSAALALGAVTVLVVFSIFYGVMNRTGLSFSASARDAHPAAKAGGDSKELPPVANSQNDDPQRPSPATPSEPSTEPATPQAIPEPKTTPVAKATAEPKRIAEPKPAEGRKTGVHLASVRAAQASWVSACADSKPLAGKLLQSGNNMEIQFSQAATVLVGNSGGVEMTLDGKPLGSLGPTGQVRTVRLTPDGFRVASFGTQECNNN